MVADFPLKGLFKFPEPLLSIVFGTLFLLDLIAILSKVMSRPGPYDVLVEFPEMVSSQNLIAFKKRYPKYADAWAETAKHPETDDTQSVGVDLRDASELARLLFRTHYTSADGVGK